MGRTIWIRRISTYVVAAIMTGFGFTGVASAQTITNTGSGSTNTISTTATNNCRVTNNNNVSVSNRNHQYASSGDATDSGNTTSGLSWIGWSALNPAAAQANGTSYNSWMNGITNWVSQRASGDGWNSNQANLSWTPASADWASFDPIVWQANGQSFGNWYNSVEAYLNSNSGNWLLTWPPDATGTGSFGGATTGNATNNNNANFSININNAARAAAGTNSCGQSNFTPPLVTGGMGGGGTVLGTSSGNSFTGKKGGSGSLGLGSFGFSGGSFRPATTHVASAPIAPHAPTAPAVVTPVVPPTQPASASSISNTGTNSTNTISSNNTNNSTVSNDNTIAICNTSTQSASSGDSSVSGNTSTGTGGSGGASNTNDTGAGVGLTN